MRKDYLKDSTQYGDLPSFLNSATNKSSLFFVLLVQERTPRSSSFPISLGERKTGMVSRTFFVSNIAVKVE